MGVISPAEYILYLWASLSMVVTSVIKKFGSEKFFNGENYSECVDIDKNHGRIFINWDDSFCMSYCDIALYTSILSFLAALLFIFIYNLYVIMAPFFRTRSNYSKSDSKEELTALKSSER